MAADEQRETARRHIERQFDTLSGLAHTDDRRSICDLTTGAVIALEAVGLLTDSEADQYFERIEAIRANRL